MHHGQVSSLGFLKSVLARPSMYTMGGTFEEVIAFLEGFHGGLAKGGPYAEAVAEWASFQEWLADEIGSRPSDVFREFREIRDRGDPIRALESYLDRYPGLPG